MAQKPSKRTYRCEFTFKRIGRYVRCDDGIAAFKDGFWLNADLRFTKGSDAKFWIPPHAIEYIAIDEVKDAE